LSRTKKDNQTEYEHVPSDVAENNSEVASTVTLKDIMLHVKPGALVVVYGATGSGKSSLLSALLGEIAQTADSEETVTKPRIHGTVAFVPQKAWCQHASVRANVTFNLGYDRVKYRAAVRACALEPDFKILERGDFTKIGSRGINLSGGQQARVNLARAVYAAEHGTNIVVLDDPLSAVDAHVGAHLFECAILGALRHTTRVLVTHQVALTIDRADYIVIVDQGYVSVLHK
jgi:ABC-type multidrug transport system fused ATPase/permease subunit